MVFGIVDLSLIDSAFKFKMIDMFLYRRRSKWTVYVHPVLYILIKVTRHEI